MILARTGRREAGPECAGVDGGGDEEKVEPLDFSRFQVSLPEAGF